MQKGSQSKVFKVKIKAFFSMFIGVSVSISAEEILIKLLDRDRRFNILISSKNGLCHGQRSEG